MVRLSPTSLVAFTRNRTGGPILRSESSDDGRTWNRARGTPLPSNNSSIAALRLPNNELLVCFNNASDRRRFPLTAALSNDNGLTFYWARDLVSSADVGNIERDNSRNQRNNNNNNNNRNRNPGGKQSYPALALAKDNDSVHVLWTDNRRAIRFATLSLDWFSGGDGFSEGEFRNRETNL